MSQVFHTVNILVLLSCKTLSSSWSLVKWCPQWMLAVSHPEARWASTSPTGWNLRLQVIVQLNPRLKSLNSLNKSFCFLIYYCPKFHLWELIWIFPQNWSMTEFCFPDEFFSAILLKHWPIWDITLMGSWGPDRWNGLWQMQIQTSWLTSDHERTSRIQVGSSPPAF